MYSAVFQLLQINENATQDGFDLDVFADAIEKGCSYWNDSCKGKSDDEINGNVQCGFDFYGAYFALLSACEMMKQQCFKLAGE